MARKSPPHPQGPRSLDRLKPFEEDSLMVVIETPKGSPNKLAFAPRHGTFVLKGVLPAGAVFPFDFGFVPSTLGEDGDPLDVLLLMDAPVFPGCIVPSRLIGVIEAEQTDEGGKTERNDRLLAVAENSAAHRSIQQLSDLSQDLVSQIEHFFVSYNQVKGKQFEVRGRAGRRRALALVTAGMKKQADDGLSGGEMAKYGKSASKNVKSTLHRRKKGTLKSGSGRTVKSREQAIAIGLNEARKKGAKVPRKSSGGRKRAAKEKSGQ
jgi:inorganic pyrophosphatase